MERIHRQALRLLADIELYHRQKPEEGIRQLITMSDEDLRALVDACRAVGDFGGNVAHIRGVATRLRTNRGIMEPD